MISSNQSGFMQGDIYKLLSIRHWNTKLHNIQSENMLIYNIRSNKVFMRLLSQMTGNLLAVINKKNFLEILAIASKNARPTSTPRSSLET